MNPLCNMPVARKFSVCFGLVCTLCAVLGGVALAERTKIATEEIANSISSIQTETRDTLKLMESGKSSVAAGLAESENARHTLESIIALAHSSEEQIGPIASASTEQAAASERSVHRSPKSLRSPPAYLPPPLKPPMRAMSYRSWPVNWIGR